ncbi:MAG TPA: Si-specific NAD(P)(+) transhydrogenase [Kofleriaceae bacterium]|nr:Si-specific NAD(P)(+) transhydrogenase [Kofleriaceae bacterium]
MSPPFDYDLVCIGSGPAGQRAAVQAAKLGKRVAVIEKQRVVGGVCIETGTIPSKTFREAVRTFSVRTQEGGPRVRPTMQQLVQRVAEVVQLEVDVVQDQLSRNDVQLIRGHAAFVDAHSLSVESEAGRSTLSAEHILIAVGTRPSEPGSVKPDGRTVILSDSIVELEKLPRNMVVVGGGIIGIEYASMFAALGVHVTVVDKRPRPLEFIDQEIVDELVHQLRQTNVTLRGGDAVESIEISPGPPRSGVIRLESGKHLVAEVVLFSVGRTGATDNLNLAAVGLAADDRGRLKVDDHLRTSVPHVYAAGDVIGYPALAATSSEQGRLAACHMFGLEVEPMAAHFPIGVYAIPEISMVGATEEELTRAKVPYETGIARFREIARGQILGDDSGMFKMIFHREDRRLLGVHCIGTGATELIHIGQAVIGLGGGLDYFLRTVFNYPTLAECYKVAALHAANKLHHAAAARQGL